MKKELVGCPDEAGGWIEDKGGSECLVAHHLRGGLSLGKSSLSHEAEGLRFDWTQVRPSVLCSETCIERRGFVLLTT